MTRRMHTGRASAPTLLGATLLLGALLLTPSAALAGSSQEVKRLKAIAGELARANDVTPDDPRLEAAAQAIAAVGKQDDEDAAKLLLGILTLPCTSATVEVNLAAMAREALIATQSAEAHDEVRKTLSKGKKNAQLAVVLAEVVGAWPEPASASALADLLESKDERVVMAGARGLGALGIKEGLGALVEAFGKWQERGGEPVDVIGRALFDITGLGMTAAADWTKWWKEAGKDWTPAQRGGGAGGTGERPRNFQSQKPPSLFGSEIEITSRRVVIVLDTSGSMHIRNFVQDPLEEVPPTPEGSGSTTRNDPATGGQKLGGGVPNLPHGDPTAPGYEPKKCTFGQCPGARGSGPECPSDENLPEHYTRLNRLVRQAKAVVRGFHPSTRFTMIAFSTDARPWKGDKLVTATPQTKDKAVEWLSGLQPNGATSADKALVAAFEVEDADTIIFVTDGAPTTPAGKVRPPEDWREMLDEVKRLNKFRKLTIDVIAIAEGHSDFSSGLAEENGGQYVTVD